MKQRGAGNLPQAPIVADRCVNKSPLSDEENLWPHIGGEIK